MVTGLPFSLKSYPVDGLLVKLQSQDSEIAQSLSFGEILRAKEKQLEQEINISSAVLALAAMQTSFVTIPTLELSVKEEIYKADVRPALEKGLPQQLSPQQSSAAAPSRVETNPGTTLTETQKSEVQANPPVVVSTPAPSSAKPIEKPENHVPGKGVQTQNPSIKPSASPGDAFPKPKAGKPDGQGNLPSNISGISRTQYMPDQGSHFAARAIADSEAVVLPADARLEQTAKIATSPTQPTAHTDVTQGEMPREVVPQTLSESATNPIEAKVIQTEIAEPKVNPRASEIEVPSPSILVVPSQEQEIPPAKVEAKQTNIVETKMEDVNATISSNGFPQHSGNRVRITETPAPEAFGTLPPEAPAETPVHADSGNVTAGVVTNEEKDRVPSIGSNPETISSQATASQRKTVPGVPADTRTVSLMDRVPQSINETDEINHVPADEAIVSGQPPIVTVSSSFTKDRIVETQIVDKQNTPPVQKTDTRSSQPVKISVDPRSEIGQGEDIAETRKTEPRTHLTTDDATQAREALTKNVETSVSKTINKDVNITHEADKAFTQSTFNAETPGTASVPKSVEVSSIESVARQEAVIAKADNAAEQVDSLTKNTQSAVEFENDLIHSTSTSNSHLKDDANTESLDVNAGSLNVVSFQATKPERVQEKIKRSVNTLEIDDDLQAPAAKNTVNRKATPEKQANTTKQAPSVLSNLADPTSADPEEVIAGAKRTPALVNTVKPVTENLQPDAGEFVVLMDSSEKHSERGSVESTKQALFEPVFTKKAIEQQNVTVETKGMPSANEKRPRIDEASRTFFGELPPTFVSDTETGRSNSVQQSALPAQEIDTSVHQSVHDSVTSQAEVHHNDVTAESQMLETQRSVTVESGFPITSAPSMSTDHIGTQTATNKKMPFMASMETPSDVVLNEGAENNGKNSSNATKAEKQIEVSVQVVENPYSADRIEKASIEISSINSDNEADTRHPSLRVDTNATVADPNASQLPTHNMEINADEAIASGIDQPNGPIKTLNFSVHTNSRDSIHVDSAEPRPNLQVPGSGANMDEKPIRPAKPAAANNQSIVWEFEAISNSVSDIQIHSELKDSNQVQTERPVSAWAPAESNDLLRLDPTKSTTTPQETQKYAPQPERPSVANASSETGITHGNQEVKAQTAIQAEESSIPLEQTGFDSGFVHKGIMQETAGFELEVVGTLPQNRGASTQVSQSRAHAVNTNEAPFLQPAIQTTAFHSLPDDQPDQGFDSQRNISFEEEAAVSRATIPSVEPETNVAGENTKVTHDPVVQANAPEVTQPRSETPVQDAQPILRQDKTSFESKNVETKARSFASAFGVTQTESVSPTIALSQKDIDNRTGQVTTQTFGQDTSPETIKSDLPEVAPSQSEVREKPVLDPQNIEKQVHTKESVFETSQAISDRPVPSFSEGGDTQTNSTQSQVVGQSIHPEVTNVDIPETTPLQPDMGVRGQITDSKEVANPASADELVVENWQPNSDLKDTAKTAALSGHESQNEYVSSKSIVSAKASSEDKSADLPGMNIAPLQAEAQQERISVESENAEKQAGAQPPITAFSSTEIEVDPESARGQVAIQARPQAAINLNASAVPPIPIETDDLDAPKRVAPSYEEADDEAKVVNARNATQETSFQADTDQESVVVNLEHVENSVGVSEFTTDVSQPDAGIPAAVASQTVTGGEPDMFGSQTIPQTIHPDQAEMQEAKSFQTEIDLEKQASGATTVHSPANEKAVDKSDSDLPTSSNLEANPPQVISAIPAQDFDTPRIEANKPQDREISLPASPGDNKETHSSVRPEVFTKEDSGQQDSPADDAHLADKKIRPIEKEHELNEILESASVIAATPQETVTVGHLKEGQPAPVNLHAVEVVQQVIRQLNGRIKGGLTSMRLRLNPEKLGAIDVEMVREAQGVSVTFFAEQASTGKLLETQLSQLRQSLVESGVQLSGLNIGQHNRTGQEGGFAQQNTNFARHSQQEGLHREANPKESPRAGRVTGQMSEVDYLI